MSLRFAHACFRERFAVFVHGPQVPTDEEWTAMCEDSEFWSGTGQRILVVSQGGAPNSRQRSRVLDQLDKDQMDRIAVVTRSPLARAVGSVLTWFIPGIRSFRPEQMPAALDYLGVVELEERTEIIALVQRLQEHVEGHTPATRVS